MADTIKEDTNVSQHKSHASFMVFTACASENKPAISLIYRTSCNNNTTMSDDPAHLCTVSYQLSRTLDEVGLNELTVNRRRHAYLYRELIESISHQLAGSDIDIYHFGSQTEGTTTPGLGSDLDMLGCYNEYRIIQDWAEWTPGEINFLMLQDNTAPGYCRLQCLESEMPIEKQILPSTYCAYDNSGRMILKNTLMHHYTEPGNPSDRNGPAHTLSKKPGSVDSDIVPAYRYNSWPGQADEFIRRHRRNGWPSQQLLQQAIKDGVFLVPVGYKLSQTEELEWRLSASLTERYFMFSLSIVHIKCYVLLKMLIKTFVEPRVSKCISSYHCKTAIFYCTENTEPGFWREENLIQCVTKCLTMLLTWITNGFCPHFVISQENLFAGKVTAHNRGDLVSVLTDLIKNKDRGLLQIQIDDLGHKLQEKLNSEPSVMLILDSHETIQMAGLFEYHKQHCMIMTVCRFVINNHDKRSLVISYVYHCIEMLNSHNEPSDRLDRQTKTVWIHFLSSWLGCLLASVAISHEMRVPRQALRLLRIGAQTDCASTLKLASVLYCSGDFQRAEIILQKIEEHFCRIIMQVVCACYERPTQISLAICHLIHQIRRENTRAKLFAHCVKFSSHESHCAPPALRIDLFRPVGDDVQHREPCRDLWMDLVVVDCLPFLYYLQYMTYRQLGQRDLQTRAINNLHRCIREDNDFPHLETAWNLLGQCMELEQQPYAAMACYRTSLDIRPRNNAANWHVAIFCYKTVRNMK